MKKENIIAAVLIYFFVILQFCSAQENNSVSGKIEGIDGESVYIKFDKFQIINKGTIFGIYDLDDTPVAICEITKFHFDNSYLGFILIQINDVKEGYAAFSDVHEEQKIREKIKKGQDNYFDFFKTFTAQRNYSGSNPEAAKEFLLYRLFTETIRFLKLDIYYFLKYDLRGRKEVLLNSDEKITLDIYRDIISEGCVFNVNRTNSMAYLEAKVNLGKLKYRLSQQGYSLKPKIIRLVFSSKTLPDELRLFRDIILNKSRYVSGEEEDYQDVTSPVSSIIYTAPKIFAEEIEGFEIKDYNIFITVNTVEGDTIELDVGGY